MSGPVRDLRAAIIVCGAVVIIDQGSKALADSHLSGGEEVRLLPFLALDRTTNEGVAFGLAGGASPLVIAISGVAVVALLAFLLLRVRMPGVWLAAGLLLGGALGNLADRARQGGVTDFIDLPAWPTFNLADMAITVGILVLLLAHWRRLEDEPEDEGAG